MHSPVDRGPGRASLPVPRTTGKARYGAETRATSRPSTDAFDRFLRNRFP